MLIVDLTPSHSHSIIEDIEFSYNGQKVDECSLWSVFPFSMLGTPWTFCMNEGVPFWGNSCNLDPPCDLLKALGQIPIYLVDRSLTERSVNVGYFGRSETVKVPDDKNQGLPLENVSTVKIMKNKEVIDEYVPAVNVTDDGMKYEVIDMLGCYRRTFMPTDKDYYPLEATKPEIFIWLDKIEEYVDAQAEGLEEDTIYLRKQALTTLVILHELSHALMDPYLFGCQDKNAVIMDLYGQKQYSLFYELKEESLANAMALKLIEGHVRPEEWDFLVDFVKAQPLQYALGYDYYEIYDRFMSNDWLEKKVNKKINRHMVKWWIQYVTGVRPLDSERLKGFEELLYGDKK